MISSSPGAGGGGASSGPSGAYHDLLVVAPFKLSSRMAVMYSPPICLSMAEKSWPLLRLAADNWLRRLRDGPS